MHQSKPKLSDCIVAYSQAQMCVYVVWVLLNSLSSSFYSSPVVVSVKKVIARIHLRLGKGKVFKG